MPHNCMAVDPQVERASFILVKAPDLTVPQTMKTVDLSEKNVPMPQSIWNSIIVSKNWMLAISPLPPPITLLSTLMLYMYHLQSNHVENDSEEPPRRKYIQKISIQAKNQLAITKNLTINQRQATVWYYNEESKEQREQWHVSLSNLWCHQQRIWYKFSSSQHSTIYCRWQGIGFGESNQCFVWHWVGKITVVTWCAEKSAWEKIR